MAAPTCKTLVVVHPALNSTWKRPSLAHSIFSPIFRQKQKFNTQSLRWLSCNVSQASTTSLQNEAPGDAAPLSDPTVVVTRERGKNRKLVEALKNHGIKSVELPLIHHIDGPCIGQLPLALKEGNFDWVMLTSPEGAIKFVDGWKKAGCPRVRLAVIGKGTVEIIDQVVENREVLEIGFMPSVANGKALALELPYRSSSDKCRVLYPASIMAGDEVQKNLNSRGFEVERLDAYFTTEVDEVDAGCLNLAIRAPVVTFASPTAVAAWKVHVTSKGRSWQGAVACIGSTTAVAARKAGMEKIFHPENPGLDGWVESIIDALKCMGYRT